MKFYVRCGLLICSLLVGGGPTPVCAQQDDQTSSLPRDPQIAQQSDEAEQAMMGFRKPAGFDVQLFAAEPMLANPVAFCIDERGRIYACESFRQNVGVTDNRSHDERWLDADLAAQTVEDRIRYHRELLGEKAEEYTWYDDRIRLLEDTDGDHRADKSVVFAEHFHQLEEGTGAGVLAVGGDVYYTCIPRLWRLRDLDGDGRADERTVLHDGYGVRVAFRGHDLHGLIMGPDGRLYFSVGDRGYHVETEGRTLADPESGAVFRCNPDGTQLEVFATGLRNPQELAFDEYGNLFTGDNNSDSGDRARWVYVVQGGDSGWRMAYQYLPDRGPFNRESIWKPFQPGQPAYIVPPIANVADGPSGLAYYPGTGLGDHYRGKFFLCDFRGGPANSGVRTLSVQPRGAFFEVAEQEELIWNILATDVAFGPDGALYVCDWVTGWNGEGKGRIYRFSRDDQSDADATAHLQHWIRTGLAEMASSDVVPLLEHSDQRIRQLAQFALVQRSEADALRQVALSSNVQLARLHAMWGYEQLLRAKHPSADPAVLRVLLEDEDAEVRAQAARLLGELRDAEAFAKLVTALRDESPRVRYFAANALGRLQRSDATAPLLDLLAVNADQDPIIRHGGIMGLAGSGDVAKLVAASGHASRSSRLGAVVALRRLADPGVASFLRDGDVDVALEAARAIYDLPIPQALPQLAGLLDQVPNNDALIRRALNANFRLGGAEHARAVALLAARGDVSAALRVEALDMLANWAHPGPRDRLLGMWRPLEPRSGEFAVQALRAALPAILAGDSALRQKALEVAALLGIGEAAPMLREIVADAAQPAGLRGSALQALDVLRADGVVEMSRSLLNDPQTDVRIAALRVLAAHVPAAAAEPLSTALQSDDTAERQAAAAILGTTDTDAARALLAQLMQRLVDGQLAADTQLDVLEAARQQGTSELAELVQQYERGQAPDDPLAAYRVALEGGNAVAGRRIFFERTEVSCVRCHKVDGVGGEVGPDLSKLGLEKSREYLLEAIVAPNRSIAENFQTAVIVDVDGLIHTGIVKAESNDAVSLITAEGKLITIPQDAIEARSKGKSAMPEDVIQKLSLRDVRDLVAFLKENGRGG